MRERKNFRPNRVLSAADAERWEETLRVGGGFGKYSRAQNILQSAVQSVARENASVWIFNSEQEILASPDLSEEEKTIACKVFREQNKSGVQNPERREGYAGWLRIGWGPNPRLSGMELLRGEEDLEITKPYYGGH